MSAISTDIRNESLPARIYLLMLCTTSASSKYLLYDHISCFGRFDQAFSYVNGKTSRKSKRVPVTLHGSQRSLGFSLSASNCNYRHDGLRNW